MASEQVVAGVALGLMFGALWGLAGRRAGLPAWIVVICAPLIALGVPAGWLDLLFALLIGGARGGFSGYATMFAAGAAPALIMSFLAARAVRAPAKLSKRWLALIVLAIVPSLPRLAMPLVPRRIVYATEIAECEKLVQRVEASRTRHGRLPTRDELEAEGLATDECGYFPNPDGYTVQFYEWFDAAGAWDSKTRAWRFYR